MLEREKERERESEREREREREAQYKLITHFTSPPQAPTVSS